MHTLVRVLNNSSNTVSSLPLSASSTKIFSLEEDLTASDITPGPPTTGPGPGPGPGAATPEPATYSLLATGLAGCVWLANRRKASSRS